MTVKIGVTLPQFTADPERFLSAVERAAELGFDSVWVFDHLWPLGGNRERPILECWTALSYLAFRTSLQIGTLVTRASLRHPALLAKMAATVGAIAPGRLIVTIGSGDHLNKAENESFGLPYYKGEDRAAQLVSTIEVVQRYLKAPTADLDDAYVSVRSLPSSPRALPSPPVWVGGRSVELLEVAGRIADGWNGWGANLETFADDALKVRALAADRPFEVSWAGQVMLADSDSAARTKLGERNPAQFVVGGPATVGAELRRAVDGGATHLIVALPDAGSPRAYEALAVTVAGLR
jgi:alkanesulfonate monooxygenase SsuD/methylene tetrahydromethanopterin reductase-like flavin-dependent oxidoreductase (luciferase family)